MLNGNTPVSSSNLRHAGERKPSVLWPLPKIIVAVSFYPLNFAMFRQCLALGFVAVVAGHGEAGQRHSTAAIIIIRFCGTRIEWLPKMSTTFSYLFFSFSPFTGAMVQPRSRNSIDYLGGVNTQRCSNSTGDKCNNGQVRTEEIRNIKLCHMTITITVVMPCDSSPFV